MFKIYIPSRNRAGSVITPLTHPNTTLLVHKSEEKAYRKCHPEIPIETHGYDTIGKIRQHILATTNQPYVLMFDDDLRFFKRNEEKKLRPTDDFSGIVEDIMFGLSILGYGATAIGHRLWNNAKPDLQEITLCSGSWGVSLDIINKEKIRIPPEFHIEEDTYISLALLERGYTTAVFNRWAMTNHGTPTTGCGAYRTDELKNEMLQLLAQHFNTVTLVQKGDKITKRINWRAYK